MPSSWRSRRKIDFKLGKHAQHVEECLASRGSSVHGLLGRAQRYAGASQLVCNVLQVFHRAGKAIDAGHNQGVSGLHEVKQDLQLGSPITAGTAGLLSAHDVAAGRLEGNTLDREILVESADACVAVKGHFVPEGFKSCNETVSDCRKQPNGIEQVFHAAVSQGLTLVGRTSSWRRAHGILSAARAALVGDYTTAAALY